MPVIEVKLVTGRSAAVKASLIRALTDAAELTLKVPRDSIRVLLHELPPENWGVAGEPKREAPK